MCAHIDGSVSGKKTPALSQRTEWVYIFCQTYPCCCMRAAPFKKNKCVLPCLNIHLIVGLSFWTGNIWRSWSLLGTPGVLRARREPCTLERTEQINNRLPGAPLDASLTPVCYNEENIPEVPGDSRLAATSTLSAIRKGLWCIIHTLLLWAYPTACEVHRVMTWRMLDALMMKYWE